MPCPDENELLSFVSGRVPGERAAELEAHLDECAQCRRAVAAAANSRGAAAGGQAKPEPSQRKLEPGDRLGRYILRDRVGSGAMGTVYRARDTALEREVALKVLHRPEAALRLIREAKAIAQLAHPN